MPDWWSWNPLDWLNTILTVPFCGLMFIVLALIVCAIAKLVAEWVERKTLAESAKPIEVDAYRPTKASVFDGFLSPWWSKSPDYKHNQTVELATLVLLREQARLAGRRQAEKEEQEV